MATDFVACTEVGPVLCKALGLDPHAVYRLVIDVAVNDMPMVYVQKHTVRNEIDAIVEGLRADHQVELERAESGALSPQAIQDSYHVHGHLYVKLRLRN